MSNIEVLTERIMAMIGKTSVRSTSSLLIYHEASRLTRCNSWINIIPTIVTKVDILSRACCRARKGSR